MVDGLKLYEEVSGNSEVSKLVSLVNDLRTAGKRGQIQGKFTAFFNFFSFTNLSNPFSLEGLCTFPELYMILKKFFFYLETFSAPYTR